jgi:putative ABC transport system permease protein
MRNPAMRVAPYSANALLPFADLAPRFLAIFSVVTLLTLLLVSANIANLMLSRAVQRQRDTAVRQSLGAPRVRLVRTVMAEGATLATVGWLAACVVAWWMSRVLLRLIEPRPDFLAEARPDWTFAAYAMTLAGLTTLAFSVGPSVRIWRLQVLPLLKAGEHSVVRGRSRLADALVVLQFTLSVLLVTTAGLAYRSMSLFDSGDLGFNTENLLLVTVRIGASDARRGSGEPSAAERDAGFARLERVREKLAQTPNVEAVTYGRRAPGAYFNATTPVWRESGMAAAQAFVRAVGPDYLRTMALVPNAGRELTAIDRRGAGRAAVINQQLAQELFPGASPLGHTLLVGAARQAVTIVGVAPQARLDGPTHERQPRYVLIAEQQLPGAAAADPTFYMRHRGNIDAITPVVSRAIAEVDAAAPIVSISTMNARLAEVTVFESFLMRLMVSFAAMSLFIAALGQYAVALFTTRRRARDFGVRLALGASRQRIQGRVIREAFALALPGLLIGFALSVAVATTFRTMLFGVTPVDPPTYAGVFLLLTATSVLASYLPARRAGRVNILDTLRQE